jgi:hypothetical protein
MNDLYLEWGPARHRASQDQSSTVDQRDADRDRPDDN